MALEHWWASHRCHPRGQARRSMEGGRIPMAEGRGESNGGPTAGAAGPDMESLYREAEARLRRMAEAAVPTDPGSRDWASVLAGDEDGHLTPAEAQLRKAESRYRALVEQ